MLPIKCSFSKLITDGATQSGLPFASLVKSKSFVWTAKNGIQGFSASSAMFNNSRYLKSDIPFNWKGKTFRIESCHFLVEFEWNDEQSLRRGLNERKNERIHLADSRFNCDTLPAKTTWEAELFLDSCQLLLIFLWKSFPCLLHPLHCRVV